MSDRDPQEQRQFALSIVRRLRAAGFEAYWAGGCVRDALLGRQPKDYDVATDARPEQVRELFGKRATLAIGAAFGVIAVVGPRPAGVVEVTTFRQDAGYSDGRHPDEVHFTSAEQDAGRRDFTINGLFFDPLAEEESGRVIDFVGGLDDLRRKVIRAIGDPHARFHEDKLRMLRGVRFAATFDFRLDDATLAATGELAASVTAVSPERIAQEMRGLLVVSGRARAVDLLRETGLLDVLLPELTPLAGLPLEPQWPERGTIWQYTLTVLDRLDEPSFPLALAALAHASAAQLVRRISARWKLSNKETDLACWLVEQQHALLPAEKMPWHRLQRLLITPAINELLALHAAIAEASGREQRHVAYCRDRLRLPPGELNPPPLLTGDDLLRHGVPPGKLYKLLLEAVRDAQLDKTVGHRDEALALVDRLVAEHHE
ncbi:MAG TPA: CCA tRNA nucleotidyltransferase [Pirellulales bacterium]